MSGAGQAIPAAHIVGVAESPLGFVPDQTELSMASLAALDALDDAGMSLTDVDGVFATGFGEMSSIQLGEYLGLRPTYVDSTDVGGASFEAYLHHAAMALTGGRCEVGLIAMASRQRSRRSRSMFIAASSASIADQFQDPYGLPLIGSYAMVAARYMYQYGATSSDLAQVAVAARKWAQLNPKAWSRETLTVEDVLSSRLIADPLHKLDCCLVTDGGAAVIVTTAARARDARKPSVPILGAGESHAHWHISEMRDLTVTPGRISGRKAFGMAGVAASDVDVFQPYDAFTISVLLQLEDLGFCAKGEAASFIKGGRLEPGGSLPSMTSGGGLSYNHPGMFGLLQIVECVRQLRWEAGERQVPGCEIAVAHGSGGLLSSAATVVLGRG